MTTHTPSTHHLVERFNHLLRDRPHRDVLSERELEMLRLMVEGHCNREIAKLLVLSEHTVKSHVSNIFQKLGVTDGELPPHRSKEGAFHEADHLCHL